MNLVDIQSVEEVVTETKAKRGRPKGSVTEESIAAKKAYAEKQIDKLQARIKKNEADTALCNQKIEKFLAQ